MFFTNKTQANIQTYGRLIGKSVANVAFISLSNPVFFHNFTKLHDQYKYNYLADYEFLRYLSALTQKAIPEQPNVVILVEHLPEEVQTLLRIDPDVVNAFKCYKSDLVLDRLDKSDYTGGIDA